MILLYTGKDIMKLKELMRESNINKPVGMANIVSAVLLQFWNMEISDAELRAQLKPSRR